MKPHIQTLRRYCTKAWSEETAIDQTRKGLHSDRSMTQNPQTSCLSLHKFVRCLRYQENGKTMYHCISIHI